MQKAHTSKDFLEILGSSKVTTPTQLELSPSPVLTDICRLFEDVRAAVKAVYQCDLHVVPSHMALGGTPTGKAVSVVIVRAEPNGTRNHGTLVSAMVRPDYPVTLFWSEDGYTARRADCRDYAGLEDAVSAILACKHISERFAIAQQE